MPNIKSLKTFGRRKSAGNTLEDVSPTAAAPSSGFRVIPRDEATRRTTGSGALSHERPLSQKDLPPLRQATDDERLSNRGSNSTATSGHSRIFDPTVGTRFSSSSTLPSTLQSPVEAAKKESHSNYQSQAPLLPTLSHDEDDDDFGGDLFAGLSSIRRSPVIDDGVLTKPAATAFLRRDSEPTTTHFSRPTLYPRSTQTPPPFSNVNAHDESPFSQKSRTSNDGLMSSPQLGTSPPREDTPPPPPPKHASTIATSYSSAPKAGTSNSLTVPSQLHRTISQESFTRSGASEDADAQIVRNSWKATRGVDLGITGVRSNPNDRLHQLRGGSLAPPHNQSSSQTSSSANSVNTSSMTSSISSYIAPDPAAGNRISVVPARPTTSSNSSTPRPLTTLSDDEDDSPLFDSSILDAINEVNSFQPAAKQKQKQAVKNVEPEAAKKVLTAQQFELLQKRGQHSIAVKSGGDSGSEGEYEDDEEDEAVLLEKRRLEQYKKAQHIIWRQKMAKDIGDHSSPLPGRPSYVRANQSTPNLAFGHGSKASISMSEVGYSPQSGASSDDEDVPLGVLQAHGFPKKEGAPDPRLSSSSYVPFGRPMSVAPSSSGTGPKRGSPLPPFARNLPQDPYMGQNHLVNPVNRESLSFNRTSVVSGGMPTAPPAQASHPGGLVGVIAEEERQRGMRRGSPSTPNAQTRQSTYVQPGMSPMGMPMMGMPGQPGVGYFDQSSPQAQQQMYQMQLMQYMQMHMQLFGTLPPNMPPMGMGMPAPGASPYQQQPGMLPPLPQQRPISLAQSRTRSMVNLAPPTSFNRPSMYLGNASSSALSVHGLGMGGGMRGPGSNYAPSVAPSERSNIGQPSRYKPVQGMGDGGSTITTSSTLKRPESVAVGGLAPQQQQQQQQRKSFLSAVLHAGSGAKGRKGDLRGVEEDEGEDEGWSRFAMGRKKTAA